ncbi:MAG TPA: RluA family pseudouridine synthase [Minicystis sp.]|nr:RluA family pseudouridine synthase [Minicystis sp.]
MPDRAWVVPAELHARPLDGVIRALAAVPWSEARRLVRSGKVRVAGETWTDPQRAVRAGAPLSLHLRAPAPRVARVRALEADLFAWVDAAVAVVRKPAGMSTVPFGDEPEEELTLDALVREALARRDAIRGRAPLGVVQRLDKGTSGLVVFARTVAAKRHLAQQLRKHTMLRRYLAIAHGDVAAATIRSHLVPDRGDRLRGSAPEGRREGQLAVTHVERLERLDGATLVACRLETGRTHQIRIHLAEAGHPIVGETVYTRGFAGPIVPAPRPMLHAAELGFEHPTSGRAMRFEMPPPADFEETLQRLRRPRRR